MLTCATKCLIKPDNMRHKSVRRFLNTTGQGYCHLRIFEILTLDIDNT